MNNKNGFTLVELLATITILGIIAVLAVPNILGVVKRNKDKTYIEDAKKLVSLAEYQFRSQNDRPNSMDICIKDLDTDEFDSAPNGGKYDPNNSCVTINVVSDEYKYTVTLKESYGSKVRGIESIDSDDLHNDNAFNLVKNF